MKRVATLFQNQSAREASNHLTLMINCQTFYLCLCICVRMLRVVAMAQFQSAKGVITS